MLEVLTAENGVVELETVEEFMDANPEFIDGKGGEE